MTSTLELMSELNWLTVPEMTIHSTLLSLWKTFRLQTPINMTDRISLDNDNWVSTDNPTLQHTTHSWRWRGAVQWNQLPTEIRAKLSYNM